MNPKLLNKVLEELNTSSPRLDYIRGVVETLIEMQPVSPVSVLNPLWRPASTPMAGVAVGGSTSPVAIPMVDEGTLLDSAARASLEKIKELAAKSTE